MSKQTLEFFFSFRSPYSYLAAPRAFALAGRFDVEVVFRGVIPMAMRGQSVPVAKRLHTMRDTKREPIVSACHSGAFMTRSATAPCAAWPSPSTPPTSDASSRSCSV